MSANKSVAYEVIAPVEDVRPQSYNLARRLYKLQEQSITWLIFGVSLYILASFGLLGWTLAGSRVDVGHIVLRTGQLKVDQFYSGLALSFLLAPAAIMVRRISNQLALILPFSMASRQPVTLADLDKLMDPGLLASATLSKYSIGSATIQMFLMLAGAFLVPVGTLLITTGEHTSSTPGTGVTAIPSTFDDIGSLASDMGLDCYDFASSGSLSELYADIFSPADDFAPQIREVLLGNFVNEGGYVTETPKVLGPVSTSNISMENDVRYQGVISYRWKSNCEYTDIPIYDAYLDEGYWTINFTWPNGDTNSTGDWMSDYQPYLALWTDPEFLAGNGTLPIGPDTYYVAAHGTDDSTHMPSNTTGLDFAGPWWISRVKCTPTLDWQISSCTWRNGSATECSDLPNGNTTALDSCGLDALTYYMRGVPHYLDYESTQEDTGSILLGLRALTAILMYDPTSSDSGGVFKVPSLSDFDSLYGIIAESMAIISTNGFYGVAEVSTIDLAPRPVYIIRTYILGVFMTLVILVLVVTLWELLSNIKEHLPLRRATFLTIANAVRGRWWDDTLRGGCVLPPSELLEKHQKQRVMFGVDIEHPEHVGLAPEVSTIQVDQHYYGLGHESSALAVTEVVGGRRRRGTH